MIRKPIDEFFAAMRLENTAGFIFVEGPSDRIIVDQFIAFAKAFSWSAYDCTQIEFEQDDPDGGNRSRLIRLGNEIAHRRFENVLCIIDRDLDIFIGSPHETATTRYTDLANMLMYGFNQEEFHGTISRFINADVPSRLINSCMAISKFAFFARNLKRDRQIGRPFPELGRFISKTEDNYQLDTFELAKHLREGGKQISDDERAAIAHEVTSVREDRLYINDHDFTAVLSRVLRLHKNRNVLSADQATAILRAQIIPKSCVDYPLFQYLTQKFN